MRITTPFEHVFGLLICLTLAFCSPKSPDSQTTPTTQLSLVAHRGTPTLDGSAADEVWENAEWLPLDQPWGQAPAPDKADFTGQYKLAWDENNLYILVEITDDTLVDVHPNGLEHYTDDDDLCVLLDEDASGGEHTYSHNAFAYHIALDGRVVDIAPDSTVRFYDNHCVCRRTTREGVSVWEIAVKLFDGKQYSDTPGTENIPKLLATGKKIGLALAYYDNDHSGQRENLMGNIPLAPADSNRVWRDASVFSLVELQD